jgi:hypothetical protein
VIVLLPPDPELYRTPLARRLHQDTTGALLAEYRHQFEACSLQANRKLQAPLAKDEFEANRAIADGTALAAEVLRSVWEAMHE